MNNNFNFSSLRRKLHTYRYELILFTICLAIYLPTLHFPFLWDDAALILNNAYLQNFQNIKNIFNESYLNSMSNMNNSIQYYRPLGLGLLFVEKALLGDSGIGYRSLQSLIHSLCTVLLFRFLNNITLLDSPNSKENIGLAGKKSQAAFLGALFFCVSPYAVDSVLFVSNQGDLIVLLCLFASFKLHRNYLKTSKIVYLMCNVIVFSIAIFSKETGAILPVVIVFLWLQQQRMCNFFKISAIGLCYLVPVALFLFVRSNVIQLTPSIDMPLMLNEIPTTTILAMLWSIFPHRLSLMKPINVYPISYLLWFLFPAIICLWVYLKQKTARNILTGTIIWGILLAPAILAVHFTGWLSPRYLYVPSIGISMSLSVIAYLRSSKLRKILFILPLFFLLLTVVRIDSWRSNANLWKSEYKMHPENVSVLINLSDVFRNENKYKDAIVLLIKASQKAKEQKLHSLLSLALTKKAYILEHHFKDVSSAKVAYREALKFSPGFTTWLGLGSLLATHERDFEGALVAFKKAEELKKDDYEVLLAIAGALGGLQRFDEAYEYLDIARSKYGSSLERKNEIETRKKTIIEYQQHFRHRSNAKMTQP